MKQTLKSFHFDQKKSGAVLTAFVDSCPLSRSQIAEELGMTDDALYHILHGRNKDLHLERAFKVCVITGHSICEYIRLMLQDEDIDFADQIHVLRPVDMETVKFLDYPGCADHVIIQPPQDPAALVPFEPVPFGLDEHAIGAHERYTERLAEQYRDQIQQLNDSHQITIGHYEQRIELLIKEHEKRVADIKEAHARAISFLKDEHKRLKKWVVTLGVLLGIETAAVIALFLVDALNRNVGWFRGLFTDFSGSFIDSFRS